MTRGDGFFSKNCTLSGAMYNIKMVIQPGPALVYAATDKTKFDKVYRLDLLRLGPVTCCAALGLKLSCLIKLIVRVR